MWLLAGVLMSLLGTSFTQVNLALNKPASQSTTYGPRPASSAVDGNLDTHNLYCTHTNSQTDPWWRVDLGRQVEITEVNILNRGDCCGDRLSNFEILVENTAGDTSNANVCGTSLSVPQGESKNFQCPRSLKGRFVEIRIPGQNKILTLCEVKIYDRPVNLAFYKPASQSTTYGPRPASSAVDGNLDTHNLYCTHTNSETDPWWRVDLGRQVEITEVSVLNRGDCCGYRLSNFEILVENTAGDTSNAKVCGKSLSVPQGESKNFQCPRSLKGRFVEIRIPGRNKILTLCEVKVYGKREAPPPPNTAPVPGTPSPPGSCGIRPSSRIVGGVAAKHGDWPWQVMLRTTSGFPYCGGTLVSPQWIVTATHCVRNRRPSSIIVRMGAHKRTSNVGTEQDIKVTKVITHPSYHRPQSYSYDIALLKLERPAALNRYVNLACLPNSIAAPSDGTKCWITGWGRLSSGGATPDLLQQVSVPVVSRARCDKAYPGKIHDSMICAGQDQGGIDSCQGDSGGPMVCESGGRYYLHGATSWGYGCAAPGKFGVYAKVKFLMSWLNSEMAKN